MLKVSIVITSYLPENKRYLDACIKSINNLTKESFDLSTFIVTPPGYAPNLESPDIYKDAWGVFACDENGGANYSNAHAINVGVNKAIEGGADIILYANDDVIFTRDSLKNLVELVSLNPSLLLMPISNDLQGRMSLALPIQGSYRIEDLEVDYTSIMNYQSPYAKGLFYYDTLCTFAVCFTKDLWLNVGGMDSKFKKAGPDDIDFCIRAVQKGYRPAISLDAIVWHAGGVSADITHTKESREENEIAFNEKWAANV